MSYGELRKTGGVFCPNFEICMGCFVHVILLGVGCFVSLQKNMWWFLSTFNKMDVGGYVRIPDAYGQSRHVSFSAMPQY